MPQNKTHRLRDCRFPRIIRFPSAVTMTMTVTMTTAGAMAMAMMRLAYRPRHCPGSKSRSRGVNEGWDGSAEDDGAEDETEGEGELGRYSCGFLGVGVGIKGWMGKEGFWNEVDEVRWILGNNGFVVGSLFGKELFILEKLGLLL